jgi:hypothetical protein
VSEGACVYCRTYYKAVCGGVCVYYWGGGSEGKKEGNSSGNLSTGLPPRIEFSRDVSDRIFCTNWFPFFKDKFG